MTNKYFSDQFDDEEVLLVFKKHPLVMRKQIIIAGLILPLCLLPFFFFQDSNQIFFIGMVVGILLSAVVMFYGWISWNFSVFVVTDQRFIQMTQKGLWKRSVIDIGIDKIQTVSYEIKGLAETILKFGTIVIQTYVGELVIRDVYKPRHIQKQMSHILRDKVPTPNNKILEAKESEYNQ